MEDKLKAQAAEIQSALERVEEARTGDEGSDLNTAVRAINVMLELVTFLFGNVTPMTVRKMPYHQIYALCDLLPTVPGIPQGIRDMANDWRLMADEYRRWEEARDRGEEQKMLAEDNAQHGVTLDSFGIGAEP
jgi:hypothetical protein